MGFERTVFLTYMFENAPYSGVTNTDQYVQNKTYGHATAIHCNYIQKIETDNIVNKTINFVVPDGSLFPFMKESYQIDSNYDGYGWNGRKLKAIVQIVNGTGSTVSPDPANWSILDVTDQLDGYATFSGSTIPPSAFNSNTIITIGVQDVLNAPKYNLTYLNHPNTLSNPNDLVFGEEAFFFGNVNTEIYAVAYTTEIPAVLQLNEYNSTTNETWDELSPVTISEMGVFNDNNDLVGVGKLNNPITKDSTIYRTILFSIDF